MSAVVAPGGGTVTFTPAAYISGSQFKIRGTSGNNRISQFFSTWKTDNPGTSTTTQITLPLVSGQTYNATVNWGDGTSSTLSTDSPVTHTYPNSGSYTVYTTGDFGGIRFSFGGDRRKLLNISNWGNFVISTNQMFGGCSNFTSTATDTPIITTTSFYQMFRDSVIFNGPVNDWDVSKVTNFYGCFYQCFAFNQPIDKWDIRNAGPGTYPSFVGLTYFFTTFTTPGAFNQNIESWKIGESNATSLFALLSGQVNYNQPLNSWDISKITDLGYVFNRCSSFNQPLDNWNTSNVTNMTSVFGFNYSFDQNIGSWDVSKVTGTAAYTAGFWQMFYNATSFNNGGSPSIGDWTINTSGPLTMEQMFAVATSFNQPIGSWNTSKVVNFKQMFQGATSFDQDLSGWNVESAQNMTQMFDGVTLSTSNYDAMLVSWASQSVSSSVVFDGGNSQYTGIPGSAPSASRATLINTYGWTITDGGPV